MRESAVLVLSRQAVLEDDHRCDDVRAAEMGDVVALHPQRGVRQPEGILDVGQRLGSRREVGTAAGLVQHQGVLRVRRDGLLQGGLVAALGDAQGHLAG